MKNYEASLAIREHLAKADPGNTVWQRDLAVSLTKIGDVERGHGDLTAALKSYQASLAIWQNLARADSGNTVWQRNFALSYGNVGVIKATQGDLKDARNAFGQGRGIITEALRNAPDNAALLGALAWLDSVKDTGTRRTRAYLVFFDSGDAALTKRTREELAKAASAAKQLDAKGVLVDGHDDSLLPARQSQSLSVKRAQNVANELVRDGVSRQIINIQGFGSTHKLVPTADREREPQNRRVEIMIK